LRREFLLNVFFTVLINLLIKPIYIFGIERTLQNRVGEAQYGLYFSLFSFAFLFQIIQEPGIYIFISSFFSKHRVIFQKYFPYLFLLKLLLGGIFLALVLGGAQWVGYGDVFWLLLSIAVGQLLGTFVFFIRANVAALGKYRLDSLLSSLDRLLLTVVAGVWLFVPPFSQKTDIQTFVLLQISTLFVTALVGLWVLREDLPRHFRLPKFSRRTFLILFSMLRQVAPFALSLFLMMCYGRIDGVLLERLLPDGQWQAGTYAAAYRLLDAANMVGFLFSGLLIPMCARLLNEKKQTELANLVRLAFQLIFAGSIALACLVWTFRFDIMALLYDRNPQYGGQILGVLIWAFVFISGTHVYAALLNAGGVLRRVNWLFGLAIFLNVFLNVVFIPQQKAMAAAFTTVLTEAFVCLIAIWLSTKLFSLQMNFWNILKFPLYAVLLLIFNFYLQKMPPPQYILGFGKGFCLLLQFLTSGMMSIFLMFVFRFLDFKAIWRLKKNIFV
jgi:O-antigen/teichoic acid export membrane protein